MGCNEQFCKSSFVQFFHFLLGIRHSISCFTFSCELSGQMSTKRLYRFENLKISCFPFDFRVFRSNIKYQISSIKYQAMVIEMILYIKKKIRKSEILSKRQKKYRSKVPDQAEEI